MADWEKIFKKSGKFFLRPQEDMNRVIKFLKKEKAKTILDLGCGTGRHTALLARNGFEVYGTDISPHGLKLTREWLKSLGLRAKLKRLSCYKKFPFKDNSFDAVISTQVIHHNYHKKIKLCISEIKRVLKPGGAVFITVSASKYKGRASKFDVPEPRTYIPLNGLEKGVVHFIYTKKLMKTDFRDFKVLSIKKDEGNHYCLLGKRK